MHFRATIFYGHRFQQILKIVDLAGINFITSFIYSKMCNEFNIGGYNFLVRIGQFANFDKLSPRKW